MTLSSTPSATFLGSANWQLAANHLQQRTQAITGQAWRLITLPFGQYRILLTDEESLLRQANPDICIFCERIEDMLPDSNGQYDEHDEAEIYQRICDYLACIREARVHLSGVFFIFDFAPVKEYVQSLTDTIYSNNHSLSRLSFNANQALAKLANELTDCHILPLSTCLLRTGCEQAWSLKYWAMGRFPYTPLFSDSLVECLISAQQSLQGNTARVLVLDLDNTLWGGVIGDDGLTNIELGPDYPGIFFTAVQHVVKALANRGIVLALCSKNSEHVALEAINHHPNMILRSEDFLVKKINWLSKVDNLREIANEVGVGLASLCFIDDSPYERLAVRNALPEVYVPELPNDSADYADFIAQLPCFASLTLTTEDRERNKRYQARKEAIAQQSHFSSKYDYLASLAMKIAISPLSDTNRQRILQLIAKTNQFNTTTHRHSALDLDNLRIKGAHIVAISLSDRYSTSEIIGVTILLPSNEHILEIETFVLSCRALGRGVEIGILAWIIDYARQQGYAELHCPITPTPRNQPAINFYPEQGLIPSADKKYYHCHLAQCTITPPNWLVLSHE